MVSCMRLDRLVRIVCQTCFSLFPLAAIRACKSQEQLHLNAQQQLILVSICFAYLFHIPFWNKSHVLQRHWRSLHNHERIKLSKEIFLHGLILVPANYILAGAVFSVFRNGIFDKILAIKPQSFTIFIGVLSAMVLIQSSIHAIWTSLQWLMSLATIMNSDNADDDSMKQRIVAIAILGINTILLLGGLTNAITSWNQCNNVGNMMQLGVSASGIVIFNIFLLDSRKLSIPHFTPITESTQFETLNALREMLAYLITYAFILLIQGGTMIFGCSSIEPTNFVSLLLTCWPAGAVLLLALLTLFRYGLIQRNMETERLNQSKHAAELEKKITPQILDLETQDTLSDRSCAICLEEYTFSDEVFSMRSCKHVYHFRCIKSWFHMSRDTCPTCRTAIEF